MTRKILIVEDDANIRELLSIRLQMGGYDTAVATDAVSAATVARNENPDLILLDLQLPGGEGSTLTERLRSIAGHAATPVIVLTAHDASVARRAALAAGASGFVSKPIDFDELFAAVAEAVGESS